MGISLGSSSIYVHAAAAFRAKKSVTGYEFPVFPGD